MRIKSNKYHMNQNWSYTRENKETNKRVCFILYISIYYYIYFFSCQQDAKPSKLSPFLGLWHYRTAEIQQQQMLILIQHSWNDIQVHWVFSRFIPVTSISASQQYKHQEVQGSGPLEERDTFWHLLKCLANWRTHILWLTHSRAEIIKYL